MTIPKNKGSALAWIALLVAVFAIFLAISANSRSAARDQRQVPKSPIIDVSGRPMDFSGTVATVQDNWFAVDYKGFTVICFSGASPSSGSRVTVSGRILKWGAGGGALEPCAISTIASKQ